MADNANDRPMPQVRVADWEEHTRTIPSTRKCILRSDIFIPSEFSSDDVFATVAIFQALRAITIIVPVAISMVRNIKVSTGRLENFLLHNTFPPLALYLRLYYCPSLTHDLNLIVCSTNLTYAPSLSLPLIQ